MFVGEQGSDTGGLTREFFRLIQYSIMAKYMEDTGCFRHNAVAYQVCHSRYVEPKPPLPDQLHLLRHIIQVYLVNPWCACNTTLILKTLVFLVHTEVTTPQVACRSF